MKKSIWTIIIIVIVLIIFISGIDSIGMKSGEKIIAPSNINIPIKGSWKVDKYKSLKNTGGKINKWDEWIGKVAEINEKIVVFGDEVCNNPNFKVKNVDAKYYFLYFYKISAEDMEVKNSNIDVISVTSSDKSFYDFIKIDDDHLMVYKDNAFLFLNRISDETKNSIKYEDIGKTEDKKNEKNIEESNESPSGVLLGMRFNLNGQPFYRTFWIATENKILHPILQIENLLVPRKSGFWVIEANRMKKDRFIYDTLGAYPIVKSNKEYSNFIYDNNIKNNVFRNILFIGNDYIGIEYGEGKDIKNININKLQVLPIDNLGMDKNVKISEVTGEAGKTALMNSANAYILSENKKLAQNIEKKPNEENFTLIRKNGHWIMRGRLNYKNTVSEDAFEDFNINIIPPSKIINYDKLYVSWNVVKARVPDAIDAYTSPNKNIVLVVSKSYIYIYDLIKGNLSERPIKQIKINEGESIIMAEWATGDYVEMWEKTISFKFKTVIK